MPLSPNLHRTAPTPGDLLDVERAWDGRSQLRRPRPQRAESLRAGYRSATVPDCKGTRSGMNRTPT